MQGIVQQKKQYKALLIKPITTQGTWVKRNLGDDEHGLALLLEPGIYLVKANTGYYIDRLFEIEALTPEIVTHYKLDKHFKFE